MIRPIHSNVSNFGVLSPLADPPFLPHRNQPTVASSLSWVDLPGSGKGTKLAYDIARFVPLEKFPNRPTKSPVLTLNVSMQCFEHTDNLPGFCGRFALCSLRCERATLRMRYLPSGPGL
jgi:hypothetical protein